MATPERLAGQFEQHRSHVRAVAYRMLGSVSDAEDAVQEAWIRLSRTDVSEVENLRGWLTTVVARVCLDMLRARASRREDPLDVHVPDPIITRATNGGEGAEGHPKHVVEHKCQPLWRPQLLEDHEQRQANRVGADGVSVVSRLPNGRVLSVIGFTIAGGKVVAMDILADPDRLGRLDLSAIDG